jgi:hypothetical protein
MTSSKVNGFDDQPEPLASVPLAFVAGENGMDILQDKAEARRTHVVIGAPQETTTNP